MATQLPDLNTLDSISWRASILLFDRSGAIGLPGRMLLSGQIPWSRNCGKTDGFRREVHHLAVNARAATTPAQAENPVKTPPQTVSMATCSIDQSRSVA